MANNLTNLWQDVFAYRNGTFNPPTGHVAASYIDGVQAQVAKGQDIVITLPQAKEAEDVVPGVSAGQGNDSEFEQTTMTIEKVRKTSYYITGEEQRAINVQGVGNTTVGAMNIAEGIKKLRTEIEQDLRDRAIQRASRAHVLANANPPFDTQGDFTDVTFARQILVDNGTNDNPSFVANTTDSARMLGKQSSSHVQFTDEQIRSGVISRAFNTQFFESSYIEPHDASGAAGFLVNEANGYAIGDTQIAVDSGGATDPIAGDIIQFAGHDDYYVVNSFVAGAVAGTGTITIGRPGLRAAVVNNAAITVSGNYNHGTYLGGVGALTLLSRLPALPAEGDEAQVHIPITDPATGIVFDIALYPQYHQVTVEISTAWGTGVPHTDKVALLAHLQQ